VLEALLGCIYTRHSLLGRLYLFFLIIYSSFSSLMSYRIITSRLPVTRNMPFFPQAFVGCQPATASFSPLFRLLDDIEKQTAGPARRSPRTRFNPRFDITEQEGSYTLHGEFPGVEQRDVEIEFSDAQTLVIRGRSARAATEAPSAPAAAEEKPAATVSDDDYETISNPSTHQPTVEDEDAPVDTPTTATAAPSVAPETAAPAPKAPQDKIWLSERSVGQFARSFTFPDRVDQDAVRASLKNGVLAVVVPKTKKHEAIRVAIE
jgi:HSP20 family protein